MRLLIEMTRTCVLTLTLLFTLTCASKLNVPRVLLPISPKTPVNFTLEVSDGGCYTWSSSRPEAVKISPITDADKCSRKAVVTSASALSHKTSAIVLAEEQSTGELLRCDVIVNHIHTIQIAMKTRELFIEDAPEEFYARASDDQGNEFSSVDGLVFRWSFEGHSTDAESGNEPVVRWVKFADSSYEVIPSIAALEAQGYQGHVILIEGMRTGSARVSVRLEDDSFKAVPTVDVNIVVIANLVLDPPEVYVLPRSIVPLRLSQIRQGRAEVIDLPTSQYYLEVDDPKVGSVIDLTGSVKALERGTTNVRLRDRNMKDPDLKHAPYVTVHVVYPHRLSLALLPERSWATVLERTHVIQAELFDERGNFIQPNEDLMVKMSVPQAFLVDQATTNGTYHHGQAVKLGVHKVKATLRQLTLADDSVVDIGPLKTSADLEVFESISVIPSEQVLAWDPVTQPRHEIKYRATGGVPAHNFISSNTTFATIAQTGLAKTQGMGWCNISAFVPKYPHVRGDAELYVLPALDMKILPHIVEIEEGNLLYIPVNMTTRLPSGVVTQFSDCNDVSLGIELSDRKNFAIGPLIRDAPKIKGCRAIPVEATGISVTKLVLTFTAEDTVVKDSIVLSSYRKLRHLEPVNRETVLALGSSRTLVFEGGPLPWINKPSGHYRKIRVENETVATAGPLSAVSDSRHLHKDVFQVEVMCRQIGETEVTYVVGNIATSTNMHPVQASVNVKVSCAHPSRIYLTPEVRLPDDTKAPCPLDSTTQRVAAQSYLDLKLVTVIKDEKGRKLDNFSSIDLEWTLSNPELGRLNQDGVLVETIIVDGYLVLGRSYQLLKPSGKSGPLDVTARIVGYKENVLRRLGLTSQPLLARTRSSVTNEEDDEDSLSYTIDLLLVDDVSIDPGKGSLFNHQENKLAVRLMDGSGSFHVEYQPKDVARVEYIALNRTIQVTPLLNGEVIITVTDVCLWTRQPTSATIQIVGISRIDLQVSDKIEEGSSVPMSVQIYDTLGQPLDETVLKFIKLKPISGSSIVRVKAIDGLQHVVEGISLGETTIAFSTPAVRSSIVNVQVFAPLRINPRNVTLVLGATLQVISTGGPQPDAVIEYVLDNSQVASCSSNGIINGVRLGHSKLYARAVGIDRQTGKQRIYSQDQVDVHVIRLSGVRITVPLTRVRQNTEMPVFLMGLDENQTPFAFGTCNPPLTVEWLLSDHQSGQVFSPFLRSGLNPLMGTDYFAARFKAFQPGHTLLRVKVTAQSRSGQLAQSELFDEVSIQVYESLQLVNPFSTIGDTLVMMPSTKIDLRTNLDSSASVEYTIEGSEDIVRPDGKGSIHSGASLGHSSLITTATNNYGVAQTISTLVEVRSVSYMMLTSAPLLEVAPSTHLAVIPRGFELEMKLTYRDTLGRAFHGVRNQLNFRPSRFDLIRLSFDPENSTLHVYADKVGQTVLHVSDELNPNLKDFLRFDVADVIQPQQVGLTLGDVVCFSTPVLSLESIGGKWSADSKSLEIDPNAGVAVAVGVGNVDVIYSISEKQSTSTEATISSISSFRFEESAERVVTDARKTGVNFPLSFRQQGGSMIGENCSVEAVSRFMRQRVSALTCSMVFTADAEVNVEEIFVTKAEFDAKTGFYQCVVKPAGSPTAASSIVDTEVILKAHYSNMVATQVKLPFLPAVFVQTPELHVSDLQPATHLIVTGKPNILRQLEFTSSDSSSLTIYSATHPSQTSAKIPVRFNPSYYTSDKTSLFISMRSPLTGQQVEIAVKIKLFGDQAQCAPEATWLNVISSLWQFSQERALSVLSLFGTCALIYLGYRAVMGSSSSRTTLNPVVFLPPSSSPEPQAYASPFIKRGPQLWSVDNDSPLQHSGGYSRSPYSSPSPSTSSPLLQRRQSPF